MSPSSKHLLHFEGGNALSAFRAQALLPALQSISPRIAGVAARLDRERRPHRARLAAAVAAELAPELRAARIGARVTGRPRHLYSAYRTSR